MHQDIQTKIDKSTELLNEARIQYEHSEYGESERCANEVLAMLEAEAERNDLGDELDKTSQKNAIIELLAHAYNRLNTISISRSDYALALRQAETAIGYSERIGNQIRIASLLANIGNVYYSLSDYPRALEYYAEALTAHEELVEKNGAARVTGNIGNVYYSLSDYPRALEYYGKALADHEELGNKSIAADVTGNMGVVYDSLSDYPRALEYYGKALAAHEELGEKSGVARVTGNIGALYAKQDFDGYDAAKAEEYLLRALSLSTEIRYKAALQEFHKTLSDLYKYEERGMEALAQLEKHIAVKEEINAEEAKKQAEKQDTDRKLAIERAQAASEKRILNNILPEEITSRLIKGENPIADHFDAVSILFMDIVEFTKLSTTITAQQLVHLLNAMFKAADGVMRECGLEKIKTIGDAYMAVAGAPTIQEDHAQRAAQAAVKLLEVMKNLEVSFPDELGDKTWIESIPEIEVRIGIHCGPVAAGVVGENKFLYDLWGDAVNTASRMESHGEAGKIHVSEEFKNKLGADFTFTPRGEMEIKGKGTMQTYFMEKI